MPATATEGREPSHSRIERVLADYETALGWANLSEDARRAYSCRVSGFLDWLAGTDGLDGNPLAEVHARDFAVRDYRAHLKTVRNANRTQSTRR